MGYNPAEIWDALQECRNRSEPSFAQPSRLGAATELAKRLLELAPEGLRRVTFANSGAESIEAAIKLCRAATGRRQMLTTSNGFHGKTTGALAATGNANYQDHFLSEDERFPQVPYGDLEALREYFEAHQSELAGFIVEPIQGEGGIVVPPQGYLRGVQELCRAYDVPMVVDEIQTGLGRTGAMFACLDEGVQPDVLVIAKALSGGLVPVGACLCRDELYTEAFALKHSSTFAGNALAARAGLATLARLEADEGALLEAVRVRGKWLIQELRTLQERYPGVLRGVRGRGFMLGLELNTERRAFSNSLLGVVAEQRQLAPLFTSYLLNVERIRVAPTLNSGAVVRIEPALTITREQCRALLDGLDRALRVFANGDVGRIVAAIEARQPIDASGQQAGIRRQPTPAPGAVRFAFVLHPMDPEDFANLDPLIRDVDSGALQRVVQLASQLEPFAVSATQIRSPTGRMAHGELIALPHTAAELKRMPTRRARAIVQQALDLAAERGAELVGLGAYSSVVTAGGEGLVRTGLGVTSGNAFTAVAGFQCLEAATGQLGISWSAVDTAIVGAAGSISSAMAPLIAERAHRLFLLDNPSRDADLVRNRLLAVVARICRHVACQVDAQHAFHPQTLAGAIAIRPDLPPPNAPREAFLDTAMRLVDGSGRIVLSQASEVLLPMAQVVVTATSSPHPILTADTLRPGAVVCDLSMPANVGPELADQRPDVLFLDGGIIQVPGSPDLGPLGLGPGLCYACMAETVLLALDGRGQHAVGGNPTLKDVLLLRRLARVHGLQLAQLRSFGQPVGADQLERMRSLQPGKVNGAA